MTHQQLALLHQNRITKLEPYSTKWPEIFRTEKQALEAIFKTAATSIEHIGSTTIPNICSKPIIDVLITVNNMNDIEEYIPKLEQLGYIDGEDFGIPECRFLCKGTSTHCKIHILIYQKNNPKVEYYRNFKNYMLNHPAEAKHYEQLKLQLAEQFSHNRAAYTQGKQTYIQSILKRTI